MEPTDAVDRPTRDEDRGNASASSHSFRRRDLLGTLSVAPIALAGCSIPGVGRRVEWSVSVGSELPAPLTLADGALLAVSSATVHRLSTGAGATEWQQTLDAPVLKAVTAAHSSLYVGRTDGVIVALDPGDGSQAWIEHASEASTIMGFDVSDETLYVALANGVVEARDATTGEEYWHAETDGSVDEGPVVGAGSVYVGDRDGRLYAFDAATGEKRWTFDAGGGLYVTPAVADGTVYQGSAAGVLHALVARSGREQWQYDAADTDSVSVAIDGNTAYLATVSGTLEALDLDARTTRWTFGEYSGAAAAPAVGGDTVYVGGNTQLAAVSKHAGERRWSVQTGDVWHQTPRLDSDRVYTGTTDGTVHAVSRS